MGNSPTVEGAISRARRVVPQQRVGQVIVNATDGGNIFYWTDDKLAEAIHDYLDKVLSEEMRATDR